MSKRITIKFSLDKFIILCHNFLTMHSFLSLIKFWDNIIMRVFFMIYIYQLKFIVFRHLFLNKLNLDCIYFI